MIRSGPVDGRNGPAPGAGSVHGGVRGRPHGRLLDRAQAVQFVVALGPTCAALAVQFVTFAVTARGLGVGAFGAYSVILATCAICGEMVGIGSADLLVRAVARDPAQMGRYFANLLGMSALTLIPAGAVAYGVVHDERAQLIAPGFILIAIVAEIGVARISTATEMIMVAHRHVLRASIVRLITPLARLITAMAYFRVAVGLAGWTVAVFAQSALISAMLLAAVIALYGRPRGGLITGELGAGVAFAVPQASRAIQSNFDRVALAQFAAPAALGAYSAGARVLQLGLFPLQVMTRILYPQFFIEGAQGLPAARRFAVGKLPLMAGVGVAAMLCVAGAGLLAPRVLGASYGASRDATLVLSLALPLMAMQYLAGDTLSGSGHQALRATIHLIMAVVSSVVLALGAAVAGVPGVLTAFVGTQALLAGVMWAVVWRMR